MKVKAIVKKEKQPPRRTYQEGTFAVQLATILKIKGITQRKLAMELGVSPQCVSKWLHVKAHPNFTSLCHIADFLGVTVDYLLGR